MVHFARLFKVGRGCYAISSSANSFLVRSIRFMAKPHRTLKKANHGRRPANSKARRLKRKDIRT